MLPNPGSAGEESSTTSEAENDGVNQADAAASNGEHESASESSNGADAKETVSEKDWDPLSVVKKAAAKDPADEGAPEEGQGKQADGSSESGKDGQNKDGAEEPLGEVTAEELGGMKPKTRKRFEALLDDRQRLNERLEAREPLAEQMETLQNFMQERQLTPANVSELLVVGGLAMSADPKDLKAALTRVDQFRDQIRSQLGEVLPDDLQKKVDDGLLDAESAKEVALSRVNTQRAERQAETVVTQSTTEAETAKIQAVHTTIADWQSQKFTSDPDYSRKAELLNKELRLRVAAEPGGRVLDTKRALQIANEAYAEVDKLLKTLTPATPPQAKRVLQSRSPSGKVASAPTTPLDAARAGLAKTAR